MADLTPTQWARYALTGDSGGATPTDGQLAPLIDVVTAELVAANPCVADDMGDVALDGADLLNWNMFVGYSVADKWADTPAASTAATSSEVRTTVGPVQRVTKTGAAPVAAKDSAPGYARIAALARSRIACIRAGILTQRGSGDGLYALAGRRRAVGGPCTVEEAMTDV